MPFFGIVFSPRFLVLPPLGLRGAGGAARGITGESTLVWLPGAGAPCKGPSQPHETSAPYRFLGGNYTQRAGTWVSSEKQESADFLLGSALFCS